jgi:TRAP-type mannitol/chloroaromatic compound transport system permease small subunit
MTAGRRPRDDGIDDNHGPGAGRTAPPPVQEGAIARFCARVDRLNELVGWLLGPFIIFIAAAICYEVVSRGVFNLGTIWVAETAVYGSSAVYLLGGGYALLHRRHVRIDLLLGALSPRLTQRLELAMFPFLALYAGSLLLVGWQLGWTSFEQSEGTGTPWNPAIWPIKFCIPLAGLLLLLQAVSNLFRDLGLAPAATPRLAATREAGEHAQGERR